MWQLIWFLQGYVIAEIRGASPEWSLEKLSGARVAFLKPQRTDDFTIRLVLLQRDLPKARTAAQRAMCELCVLQEHGFRQVFGGLWKRRGFALLLLLAMAGAFVIPKFVFFYEVVGNETVPEAQILRELQNLGVGFGTYGPSIHPQELKNRMLLQIPKLQWLTVQQSGMRAVVVVRERPEKEPVLDRRSPVNVVAARAGVLTRVQAEAGNCLCAPGQAVTAGELLVSAYTDFGFKTQVTAARAEIYAETIRRATCVLPQHWSVKEAKTARRSAVSLLVGRRRIALFGGGIPEKPCEKETKTYWLTLPGGFSLPLGIAITGIYEYDTRDEILQEASVQQSLLGQIQTRAQRDMIAGTILDSRCRIQTADGCIRLRATLRCEEMIARMQPANLKEAIE